MATGGPFEQNGADIEAPSYDTSILVFSNPHAAERASRAVSGTLGRGPNVAVYRVGRVYVADSVGFIVPMAPSLPTLTRSAINACLKDTGY